MFSRSEKTGNVLSTIGSQGFRKKRLRSRFPETGSTPSGSDTSALMTLRPGNPASAGKTDSRKDML